MENIATMGLPTIGARVRDTRVFTSPRICGTAGVRGAAAVGGTGATGSALTSGSDPGLL